MLGVKIKENVVKFKDQPVSEMSIHFVRYEALKAKIHKLE